MSEYILTKCHYNLINWENNITFENSNIIFYLGMRAARDFENGKYCIEKKILAIIQISAWLNTLNRIPKKKQIIYQVARALIVKEIYKSIYNVGSFFRN